MVPKQTCTCGFEIYAHNLDTHVAGRRHREALAALQGSTPEASSGDLTRCDVCYLDFPTRTEFDRHQRSEGHRHALARAADQHANPTIPYTRVTGTPAAPGYIQCDICHKDIHVDVWVAHTTRHTSHQERAAVDAAREEAEKDKNGVSVSYKRGIDFGIIDPVEALRPELYRTADVKVTRTDESPAHINLFSVRLASSERGDHYGAKFSAAVLRSQRTVKLGSPRTVSVTFHPSYEGQYEDTLELTFHRVMPGSRTAQQFVITRQIRAIVGSPEDHEQLGPKAPYVRARPKAAYHKPRRIITVMRPPTWSRTKWKVRLPAYDPPEDLISAAFGRHPKAAVLQYVPGLSFETYTQFFQALLWIEEEQQRLNLAMYAMEGVDIIQRYPEYEVAVRGLGEGRPSVIVGDIIHVKHSRDATDTWYEGCIHKITGTSVRLRFNEKFTALRGAKVDVRFVLNRLPDRRMHQAISSPVSLPRLLFPRIQDVHNLHPPTDYDVHRITLIDRTLSNNKEQLETIAAIVNRPPGSVPFVVYGPPGTGKTVTIVEAIRQILAANPEARILACAPSNSAADLIALRLAHRPLSPRELFRMNSYARPYKSLAENASILTDFSLYNDNKVFAIPPLEKLITYRVIVSTCISAGIPHGLGIERGHFTHVFLDEAGQATEPMSMVLIKTLADEATNVVLAGDVRQLNPIVHSPLARDFGLKQSYLQRLMDMPIYDEKTGKGRTITKLVNHFRSHPDLLDFPNRHFYGGELVPCADPAVTHSLLKYDRLPAKNFPIIFHGVVGRDQREAESPSFFNVDEVTIVKGYLTSLLEDRKMRITPNDIGVIAPYHAQCQKILSILPPKLKGVKVGSVEEFQGQERRVIIITTVRSSTDYIAYDMRHTLGFVADAKRFNVAITRARSLLIVVGNPRTLGLDPMWREWLNFVHQKGGCRGKELDWDPTDPVNEDAYDAETRTKAEAEAHEMIQRMRAQYLHNYEPPEEEDEEESERDPREFPGREVD